MHILAGVDERYYRALVRAIQAEVNAGVRLMGQIVKFRDDGFKSIQKTDTFKTWGRINGHVKEVIAHF